MAFSPPTSRRRPPMKALGGGERSSIQKFCPASPPPGKFGMFLQVVPQGDAWERWPWRLCPKPEAGRDWGGGVQDCAQGPGKEISMKRPIVLCCFTPCGVQIAASCCTVPYRYSCSKVIFLFLPTLPTRKVPICCWLLLFLFLLWQFFSPSDVLWALIQLWWLPLGSLHPALHLWGVRCKPWPKA